MITFNRTTSILFLLFNRPETTLRVFDRIRKMQPERLYVAADGPRTAEEKTLCDAARAAVSVNWDCDVHTLFRDGNLGCGEAVSRAITWFFESEPEGIILEDDCLPADGFFGFCSAMLEKYRDDDRIGHISGGNYQKGIVRGDGSYYFSGLTNVWGWAGWRRVWKDYDRGMKTWPQFERIDRLEKDSSRSPFARIWRSHFKTHHAGFNSWDYQYAYLNLVNHRLSVIPNVNLITNTGCEDRASATHFIPDHPFAGLPAGELSEIIPPTFMMADIDADLYAQSVEFKMPLSPESTVRDFLFLKEKLVSLSEACESKMSIPRIIHQIYENPDIPEYLLQIAETWKLSFPDLG